MTARDLFPIAFYGDPRMTVDADVVNVENAPVTITPIQRKDFRAVQRPESIPAQRQATRDESSDEDPKGSTAMGDATFSPSPDPASPSVEGDPDASAEKDPQVKSPLVVADLMMTGSDAPPV